MAPKHFSRLNDEYIRGLHVRYFMLAVISAIVVDFVLIISLALLFQRFFK